MIHTECSGWFPQFLLSVTGPAGPGCPRKPSSHLSPPCTPHPHTSGTTFCSCLTLVSTSPVKPEEMDWSELYPEFFAPPTPSQSHDDPEEKKEKRAGPQVEFADIGCGYGGLLGNILALGREGRAGGLATSAALVGDQSGLSPSDQTRCCDISIGTAGSGPAAFALEKGVAASRAAQHPAALSGPTQAPLIP